MKSIVIAAGITLTATAATIAAYEAECKAIKAEREAREWLASHQPGDPEYSDVFKDVYGVRPRWTVDSSDPMYWLEQEALERSSGLS